jgi:arabinofuranosyltransferase
VAEAGTEAHVCRAADVRRRVGCGDVLKCRFAETCTVALILAITAVFAILVVNWDVPPFEDAAMLMRYAEHVAHGYGFVWNIGESPVDGGTDFLFIVAVAAARGLGLSLEFATRLVAVSAHFMTAAMIYLGMRRVQGSEILPAFLSAVYFTVGPGLFLAAAYFGTPFFTFAVVVAWLLAQRLIFMADRRARDMLAFSFACLVCGLIRPEGVLIGIFMLVAVGIIMTARDFGRLVAIFGAVFLILGGAYFAWHWAYFGHPLPNPFYVKGSEHFYPAALRESIRNSAILLLPVIPAFVLSLRTTATFRLGVAFAIPIVGSIAMWVLISSEMNFGGRFQYPVLAIGVLSWYPLVRTIRSDLHIRALVALSRRKQFVVTLVAGILIASTLTAQLYNSLRITYARDERHDVGVMLARYAHRHYTIATTEAGLLPLYSEWRAIDTWGLNDEWIAHHGEITSEYLERQRPDVIVFHDVKASPLGVRWSRQIDVLRGYAKDHHFVLAASFGISPDNTFQYYVRPDLAECDEIKREIRSITDGWSTSGAAQNLAGPSGHAKSCLASASG